MIIILLLALLGFLNAYYLYYQHIREISTGRKMFCLIGGDCGEVVGSKYGSTLGIKNEKIGMAYYSLIAVYSLVNIFLPEIAKDYWVWIKIITTVAGIFSLYLLYIQAFVLKIFCSWCLIAITINLLILFILR